MTGLALTWWWLGRRGLGTVARVALIGPVAVFLIPFAAATWLAIGLADVWLGFREREQTA
jgi:Mg2+/citrate symporter